MRQTNSSPNDSSVGIGKWAFRLAVHQKAWVRIPVSTFIQYVESNDKEAGYNRQISSVHNIARGFELSKPMSAHTETCTFTQAAAVTVRSKRRHSFFAFARCPFLQYNAPTDHNQVVLDYFQVGGTSYIFDGKGENQKSTNINM